MFRFYSKGCEYAIHALICLGAHQSKNKLPAAEICKTACIPRSFTRKYLQQLVHKELLKAVPGIKGGYSLARPASEITVRSIILAVEGEETFSHCIMGLPECNEKIPCPLHATWAGIKSNLIARLDSLTLQDLIDVVKTRVREKGDPLVC